MILDYICLALVELFALGTLCLDWSQTVEIQRRGHVEHNPILGEHPSDFAIGAYFSACILVQIGLGAFLLRWVGPMPAALWADAWTVVEGYTVGWNRALGDGP